MVRAHHAAGSHLPDRPPKTPAWNQQVNTYEERRLDGKRRVFPAHELLGAEEVLARMWFEHTTSKMSPVTLGEIVSRRTWTAARTLNPLALSRTTSAATSKALRLEQGNLVREEPTEWVPKGLFSTIDGANAARWAWILLGIGEEDEVMADVDWFVARARGFRRTGSGLHGTWRWRSGTTSPSARQPRRSWTTWRYGRKFSYRRRPPSRRRSARQGPQGQRHQRLRRRQHQQVWRTQTFDEKGA